MKWKNDVQRLRNAIKDLSHLFEDIRMDMIDLNKAAFFRAICGTKINMLGIYPYGRYRFVVKGYYWWYEKYVGLIPYREYMGARKEIKRYLMNQNNTRVGKATRSNRQGFKMLGEIKLVEVKNGQ